MIRLPYDRIDVTVTRVAGCPYLPPIIELQDRRDDACYYLGPREARALADALHALAAHLRFAAKPTKDERK